MNTFTIFEQKAPENKPAQLLIETQAYEGIKRIGARVACDIGLVAGVEPALITAPNQCENDRVVIFATLGKSPFLEMLERRTDSGEAGGIPDTGCERTISSDAICEGGIGHRGQ